MATHFSSILQELSLQPGDTDGLRRLLNSYPYFETPYILKALAEKDNAGTLHNAVLVNNNAAWLHALLQPEETPAHSTQTETITGDESEKEEPVPNEQVPVLNEPVPVQDITEPIQEEIVPVSTKEEPAPGTTEPTQKEPETSNLQPATSNQQLITEALETEKLAFEPYHTVDYFASQGIKPSKDVLPADRFSHQLRSFTEWLKTMKRLPTGEIEAPAKPGQQEEVVQLAETSLKKTEVITETMAEVLVKQGRINEAIEILQKLSLLDKAKSAYFAARIQHLKTI